MATTGTKSNIYPSVHGKEKGSQNKSGEPVNEAQVDLLSAQDQLVQDVSSTAVLTPLDDDLVGEPQEVDDRGNWSGRFDFLMSLLGYSVGLGNVWRFPYLCYKNGGGAFLLPYILMLVGVGLPLFFMELAFGQFASLGPITVWRINPLFKGLGYAMVIVSWLISLYYNVIIAQVLFYLFASFTDSLPWISCDNPWNTNNCLVFNHTERNQAVNASVQSTVMTYIEGAAYNLSSAVLSNLTSGMTEAATTTTTTTALPDAETTTRALAATMNTPAEEYYRYYVLEQSKSIDEFGSLNWRLAGCLLLAWIVVGACLIKGVQTLGKVVYFTAIFPYVMLTVLLVRGATLDGAMNGVIYYLKPDLDRLADPRVWSDAATQIFYSLSACSGGLIAMSSFNKFTNNCHRDAIIVAILNCSTSVFAGFVIFSILGFMAYEKGVDVSEVAKEGPGLAFEVYPEALSRMVVSPLWSVFFFIMMATLGFGSQFSIVECVLSALLDEFPQLMKTFRRSLSFRVSMMVLGFLLGLPMVCGGGIYLLELVDYSVGGFPLLIVGLVECVAINWIYGFNNFWGDIQMMIGDRPKQYWKICWTILTPFVIVLTIILNAIFYKAPTYKGLPFPGWAEALGWLIVMFPVSAIVVWFVYYYCKKGGFRLLKMRSMPLPHWGPALANDRKDRYSPERQGQQNFGTLQYQVGQKIYRSHLDVHEIARLLAGSSTTINTVNTQMTGASSTMTLETGANPTPVGSIWGSNTSV
ncbi:sodium- and chloride-dependent glycine transporter 1 [Aplysia californica]|uniref:Transporter n=1 Tax=Aplysia californica TaxID=6500 RepID=A0ABM1AB16_APLCA|nr:sodium- and chloride-dependent glycine transporter 1 [Aplysia californica]